MKPRQGWRDQMRVPPSGSCAPIRFYTLTLTRAALRTREIGGQDFDCKAYLKKVTGLAAAGAQHWPTLVGE